MKEYRLPNGEVLRGKKNEQRFVDAWKKFIEPIETATGVRTYSFGPGVSFRSIEHHQMIDLPDWFIERINNALTKGERYVEHAKGRLDYLAD